MNKENDKLVLIFPTEKHCAQVEEYKKKFEASGEELNGCGGLNLGISFDEWLQRCISHKAGKDLGKGYVQATQFLALRTGDGKLVGLLNLRHKLTPTLIVHGGHIGYSTAPDERKKGYATQMLDLGLQECRKLGIKKVLVTCFAWNVASAKTIRNNGGVMESETLYKGKPYQKYWIDLEKTKENLRINEK